jgi:hypothetical protein
MKLPIGQQLWDSYFVCKEEEKTQTIAQLYQINNVSHFIWSFFKEITSISFIAVHCIQKDVCDTPNLIYEMYHKNLSNS